MVDVDGAVEPLVNDSGASDAAHGGGTSPGSLLAWLRGAHQQDHRPAARLERVLAVGRALIVTTLAALYLYPAQPVRLPVVTYGVLTAYALYSLAVLAYTHRSPRVGAAQGRLLHGLDIFWVAALTLVSEQSWSAFFLVFLFVVLAAAYRWGFIGTLATTAATIAIFLVDSVAAGGVPLDAAPPTLGDPNRTFVTVASLLLAGFLLGYLAEQDKRSRSELSTLADLTREPRVRLGLSGSVVAVSRGLSRTFNARGVCFVLQDYDTRETWLWRFDGAALDALTAVAPLHLDAAQQEAWFFPDAGRVWHATRPGNGAEWKARVVQPQAWPLRRERIELPDAIARPGNHAAIAVANFGLADEWRGRVYLFDPRGHGGVEQSLHFLDGLVEHLTPALTNVFLLGRLRARVTAAERGRVARELHDGAIQALIGIEMKVEALKRREVIPPDLTGELGEIQSQLRRQVLELRELMQALRPVAMDTSEQLPDVLASVVERFRRDTGVPVRFVSAGGSASLAPATALEMVRIVQEALVNVRKHSQARNVLVKLTAGARGCILVIEDDGLGFEFEGTLSGEELDRRRIGPAIIKERARIAGAHLTIESRPGSGTRIELIVNAAHA